MNVNVGYSGAHARVRRARGEARAHSCRCGNRAEQWAYQHGSPCERVQLIGRYRNIFYSPNIDDYEPMCRPCHRTMDLARLNDNYCKKNLHELTPESVYNHKNGDRHCKQCSAMRQQRTRAA